jgi:hypothetical protein
LSLRTIYQYVANENIKIIAGSIAGSHSS